MLRRRVSQLVLSFDADSAGMGAALRSRELFQQAELTVRVLTLPDKVDPDQLVREQGQEAFEALVEAAVPIVEWELRRILARGGGSRESDRVGVFPGGGGRRSRRCRRVWKENTTSRWLAQQWAPGDVAQAATMEQAIRAEMARGGTRKAGGAQEERQPRRTVLAPERSPAKPRPATVWRPICWPPSFSTADTGRAHVGALEVDDFPEEVHRQVFVALRGAGGDAGQAVTPEARDGPTGGAGAGRSGRLGAARSAVGTGTRS